MIKRFSVISTDFKKFGVWDNKMDIRTAYFTKDFSEEQINEYVDQLNSKYNNR